MSAPEFMKESTEKIDALPYPCTIWKQKDSGDGREGIIFVEVNAPISIDTTTELPMNFEFRGVDYSRYLGFYYLPNEKTEVEFALFWDFLSDKYEQMTDYQLHSGIYSVFAHVVASIPKSNLRILDHGVGTGTYTRTIISSLPGLQIDLHGVDISARMVQSANSIGVKSKKIIGNTLPYPDCYFDAVVSCFTTHLFADFSPFEEWFRVLNYSGRIAFNHRYPPTGFKEVYDYHLRSIGFSNVSTELHKINATHKKWDIWITYAEKV